MALAPAGGFSSPGALTPAEGEDGTLAVRDGKVVISAPISTLVDQALVDTPLGTTLLAATVAAQSAAADANSGALQSALSEAAAADSAAAAQQLTAVARSEPRPATGLAIDDGHGAVVAQFAADGSRLDMTAGTLKSDGAGGFELRTADGTQRVGVNPTTGGSVGGAFHKEDTGRSGFAIPDLAGGIYFEVRPDLLAGGGMVTRVRSDGRTEMFATNGLPIVMAGQSTAPTFGPLDLVRACYIGDSNTEYAKDNATGVVAHSARGYVSWLAFLSGRRIDYQQADNYGVGGYKTDQILIASAPAAVAGLYQIAFIMAGTNDLRVDYTADTTVANIIALAERQLAAGCRVVILPILPRRDTPANGYTGPLTEAQFAAKAAAINRRIRNWAHGRLAVRYIDPRRRITDPATGAMPSWAALDALHIAGRGAFEWATGVWEGIKDWFLPSGPYVPASRWEGWDATNNPDGEMLVNGSLAAGTGGTVIAPALGTAPEGWTAEVLGSPTGGTITFGRQARTDGVFGDWLTVTAANVTGAGVVQAILRQAVPLSGGRYAAGNTVEMLAEVDVLAGAKDAIQASPSLLENDGSTTIEYVDMAAWDTFPVPPQAYRGLGATPRATIRASAGGSPALTARLVVKLNAAAAGGASVTARFGFASLHRITA